LIQVSERQLCRREPAIAEATLNGSYPVAVIQILMACACPVIDVIRLILLFTLER